MSTIEERVSALASNVERVCRHLELPYVTHDAAMEWGARFEAMAQTAPIGRALLVDPIREAERAVIAAAEAWYEAGAKDRDEDERLQLARDVGALRAARDEENRASETPGEEHHRSAAYTASAPAASDVSSVAASPSPGEVRVSQPGTPTARGSLPTHDALYNDLTEFIKRRFDLLPDGLATFGVELDAIIRKHVKRIERERDEWKREASDLGQAAATCDKLTETARQAEEENARLRERVAELEKERPTPNVDALQTALTTFVSQRFDGLPKGLGTFHKELGALLRKHWLVPPPSASAGTGTISDHDLAQELALTFKNAMGPGPWSDVGPNSYLERSRNAELAQARRAKELLGGSKAVKHERLSVGDLRVLIRGRMQDFNLTAHNDIVEEVARIAFEIIHGRDYSDQVRAALAGRGETENG